MADDLGEKTEDATPKKRAESRQQGQVAKSADLSSAAILLATSIGVAAAAVWMLDEARLVMAAALDGDRVSRVLDEDGVRGFVMFVGGAGMRIALPVLLVAWGAAFLAQFGQIGWLFAPKAVQPKFSKLNPLAGFKRVFGLNGLVKALIDSMKVLVVVAVAALTIRQHADQMLLLPYLPLLEGLASTGRLLFDLALRLLAVLIILGVVDYTYQRWKYNDDLKMTKQQVKDEMKTTEGDPMVKRRRMRMQQQIAMQRIGGAVPQADVIVTNPEHIAIAIKYDQERMNAPMVIAKGADLIALRIRQIALKHAIPVVERKPLARALYRDVAVGQEIPPDFYAAVAEVLAYVYRLGGRQAG